MRKFLRAGLLLVVYAALLPSIGPRAAHASDSSDSNPLAYTRVLKRADVIAKKRDAELAGKCVPHAIEAYPNLPTQLCNWKERGFRARAILLTPSATQLTDWVLFACTYLDTRFGVQGNQRFREACSYKLLDRMNSINKARFIVAGTTYNRGISEVFRDGVPAIIEGLSTQLAEPLTDAQLETAMTGNVTRSLYVESIAGADYVDYVRFGRTTDAQNRLEDDSAMTWPQYVANRFRTAWTYGSYAPLLAAACVNPQSLGSNGTCPRLPINTPGAVREQ